MEWRRPVRSSLTLSGNTAGEFELAGDDLDIITVAPEVDVSARERRVLCAVPALWQSNTPPNSDGLSANQDIRNTGPESRT